MLPVEALRYHLGIAEALTMTRVSNPEVVGLNPKDDDVIFRTVR